ncbi:MAG: NEW3 domain-containing protein [Actinomycetota bacterium]|nr:NEW3 domain-containing protein [Actinomycetota bacterium]
MKVKRLFHVLAVGLLTTALLALPAGAQESPPPTSLSISSPYVGVAVKPGDSATFELTVASPPGDRVGFTVNGLPEGWEGELRGGGFVVDEVQVGDTGIVTLELQVDVPAETEEGDYEMSVDATGGGGVDTLDLSIRVAASVGGEVSMTTDFPALRGPADSTYTFDLAIANNTPQEVQFGLSANGPEGWVTEIKPSGEAQASTVTVAAGETAQVTVDVDPPDAVAAGDYLITARAEGSGLSTETQLAVQITGSFAIDVTTLNEALNVTVKGEQPTDLPLVVTNTGTAPLVAVGLTATPPQGWDVTFDQPTLEQLEPGQSVQVVATITPSGDAINGDYVVSFSSSVPEASDSIEVRATVETSAVWGLVGIGVIVVALVGLSMVFRRYGRR